jgi:hypothetical protein
MEDELSAGGELLYHVDGTRKAHNVIIKLTNLAKFMRISNMEHWNARLRKC